MSVRTTVRLFCALAWLGVTGLDISVHAHETGTTHVKATLRNDRSVEIEIKTDADSLLEKLESAAGVGAERPADPSAIAARLERLDEIFRSRVALRADGRALDAAAQYSVAQAGSDPPLATVTMRSQAPASTGRLTWKFGWTFAVYTLDAYVEGIGLTSTRQLEGNEESAVPTAGTLVPGSSDAPQPETRNSGRVLALVFLCLTYALFELFLSPRWRGGNGWTWNGNAD